MQELFQRLEKLVAANSAEDPFEVLLKLLIAKLWDEKSGTRRRFVAHESDEATRLAIGSLLEEAHRAWPGTVQGSPGIPLSPAHLAVCARPLAQASLGEASLEVMDALFEFLVSKVSREARGQYFTPRHVVELCVRVMSPQPGEVVADPACGSGGFLLHALNYMREQHGPRADQVPAASRLWGFDFDSRAARTARALLVFAGAGAANIHELNSLLRPGRPGPGRAIEDVSALGGRCDVILTNPPFAGEVRDPNSLGGYELARRAKRVERDVLFIERCVELLRPGGRMAIVLPDNKFSARAYQHVREWLLRHTRILGIVGLGRHTFLPHTHQKTSILFALKRGGEPEGDPDMLFAISERPGKNSRGQPILRPGATWDQPAWTRLDHDLQDIEAAFRHFLAPGPAGTGI